MKQLKEEVSLAGKVEAITMMELRRHPGDVLQQVQLGKSFVITNHGKEIAVLSKLPGETLTMNIDSSGKASYSPQHPAEREA